MWYIAVSYTHLKYGDGTIRAAFTGQYELTQRAAAQQYGAPAYQSHAPVSYTHLIAADAVLMIPFLRDIMRKGQ